MNVFAMCVCVSIYVFVMPTEVVDVKQLKARKYCFVGMYT